MLKQLVRDVIQPDKDLGHSDRKGHKKTEATESAAPVEMKVGGEIGTGEKVDVAGVGTEEKTFAGVDSASPFPEVAANACKDCP